VSRHDASLKVRTMYHNWRNALLLGSDVTEHICRVRQSVANGGKLSDLRLEFVDLRLRPQLPLQTSLMAMLSFATLCMT